MQYVDFRSQLYSDTLVPDVFINEYMPALKSEYVKIYLYCLFLIGKNRSPSVADLARILDIPPETVKKGLLFMNNLNMISWTEDGVVVKDLKEIEINKLYRPKSTSTPEEALEAEKTHRHRRQAIDAINNECFSGVMSVSWYGDINTWFDQYGFEEDVMYMLFQHCRDSGSLKKNYIAKVADNMHSKGVINSYDFDQYLKRREELKTVSAKIQRKLKLGRRLDEYQEEYVDKWANIYGFSFEIIEMALRKTTDKPDVGFNYFDKILTEWKKTGLDSIEKIAAYEKRYRAGLFGKGRRSGASPANRGRAGGIGGFEQREYEGSYLDRFVSSDFGGDETQEAESPQSESGNSDGPDATSSDAESPESESGNAESEPGNAESPDAESAKAGSPGPGNSDSDMETAGNVGSNS